MTGNESEDNARSRGHMRQPRAHKADGGGVDVTTLVARHDDFHQTRREHPVLGAQFRSKKKRNYSNARLAVARGRNASEVTVGGDRQYLVAGR